MNLILKGQAKSARDIQPGAVFYASRSVDQTYNLYLCVVRKGDEDRVDDFAWLQLEENGKSIEPEEHHSFDDWETVLDVTSAVDIVPIIGPKSLENCYGTVPIAGCLYVMEDALHIASQTNELRGPRLFRIRDGVYRPALNTQGDSRKLAFKQWEIRWRDVEGEAGLIVRFDASTRRHGER